MENEIKKIVEERIKRLPNEIASAIKTVPWMENMKVIAKNNNLNEEKEYSFAIETTIVVLGVESPTKYPINLAENVGLDDDAVIKIAKEVDEQIIIPIIKMIEEEKQKKSKEKTIEMRPESVTSISVPEISPANLPMVERGEVAHEVPHMEPAFAQGSGEAKQPQPARQNLAGSKPNVSIPDYRYDGGKDPYREPLK